MKKNEELEEMQRKYENAVANLEDSKQEVASILSRYTRICKNHADDNFNLWSKKLTRTTVVDRSEAEK